LVLVSAIIPVYNGATTIAEAVDSALAQGVDGLEIIVVDDGSTDSTRIVLEAYGTRIKVVAQSNRGVSAACNAAVGVSSGRYLAFLDADDIWLPGRIAKTVAALERNQKAQLAFSDYLVRDHPSQRLERIAFDGAPSMQSMFEQWAPIARTVITMRRGAFERAGGFPEGIRWGEDIYLWLCVRECGEFEYVAEPLGVYRRQISPGSEQRYHLAAMRAWERRLLARFGDRAKPLVRHARSQHASLLLASALHQVDVGDRRGALRSWFLLLSYNPVYFLFLCGGNLRRLMSPRSLRRILAMLSRGTVSQGASGDTESRKDNNSA
jgi:glycosyltransferase involved in cell wall biosynthesis